MDKNGIIIRCGVVQMLSIKVPFRITSPTGLVKLSKVNLRNIGQNKPEFLSLKVSRDRYADPFNQRQKWVPL